MVCGTHPETGRVFVGTKSVFNPGTPKINYTKQQIAKNHGTDDLGQKLLKCLVHLRKLNIQGVVQGDLLFVDDSIVRKNFNGIEVVGHPECSAAVGNKADYIGSTSQMLNHVRKSDRDSFFLLTECGLTGVLQSEFPQKTFAGGCTMCKYMKSNSLEDILNVLENPSPKNIIKIDLDTQKRALQCVNRMFEYAD